MDAGHTNDQNIFSQWNQSKCPYPRQKYQLSSKPSFSCYIQDRCLHWQYKILEINIIAIYNTKSIYDFTQSDIVKFNIDLIIFYMSSLKSSDDPSESYSQDPLVSSSDLSFVIAAENLGKSNRSISILIAVGKSGTKYAKISNSQRENLIKRVTSTGCTIKSAALDLQINFSTAKAIMQIYRREGRLQKKVSRRQKGKKNNQTTTQQSQLTLPPQVNQYEEVSKQIRQLQIENQNQCQIINQLQQQPLSYKT
ncbi:hypothetical protein pb186bvf_018726 [Paramecium bursaria]